MQGANTDALGGVRGELSTELYTYTEQAAVADAALVNMRRGSRAE